MVSVLWVKNTINNCIVGQITVKKGKKSGCESFLGKNQVSKNSQGHCPSAEKLLTKVSFCVMITGSMIS